MLCRDTYKEEKKNDTEHKKKKKTERKYSSVAKNIEYYVLVLISLHRIRLRVD